MIKILQKGNEILRKISREIKDDEFSSEYLDELIAKMRESLTQESDGYAISAPQIGESVRVFLISGELLRSVKQTEEPQKDKAYINPKIIKRSKETELMEEGCLSVRTWYGYVNRSKKIKIEAFTKNGKKFQEGVSGTMAQAFQHEIDHLDGVLFTDKAVNLKKNLPIEEKK